MKNNRKDDMPLDGELYKMFKDVCSSDEEIRHAIIDAKKAYSYINKHREFRK
ncbi:MAG: hypothetical protein J0L69_12940 [Bacteroidetes bacterium]|nr:hypothetical protein [Bacteroidota bacterium]